MPTWPPFFIRPTVVVVLISSLVRNPEAKINETFKKKTRENDYTRMIATGFFVVNEGRVIEIHRRVGLNWLSCFCSCSTRS